MLNGRSISDSPAKFTFIGDQGFSVNDIVWCNISEAALIKDFFVGELITNSDHLPLFVDVWLPWEKNLDTTSTEKKCIKYKWKPNNQSAFQNNLLWSRHIAANFNVLTVDELNGKMQEAVKEAAKNSHMTVKNNLNHAQKNEKKWFDIECSTFKKKLNGLLKKSIKNNLDRSIREEFIRHRREYKTLLRNKEKDYKQNITDKFACVKNSKDFWSAIKSVRPPSRTVHGLPAKDWYSFYQRQYPEIEASNQVIPNVKVAELDSEITLEELECSLKKAKSNKTAGCDGLTNEFFKSCPENWKLYLVSFFDKILTTEAVPKDWAEITLFMLHKKGDHLNPNNYRGIALVNHIAKIFTQIMGDRLMNWAEKNNKIPEEQTGFRRHRGCLDNIFALQTAIQCQLRLKGRKVFAFFVDFEKAFDSIPHSRLWQKLLDLGVSSKFINVIKSLYECAVVTIKAKDGLTNKVKVTKGVLQGEILSPLLFCLYIADLVYCLKSENYKGIPIDGYFDLLMLLYADDLVILASTAAEMRKIIETVDKHCSKNGLKVNESKSKIVIFRSSGRVGDKIKQFKCNEKNIEVVESYVYLGTTFSSSSVGRLSAEAATCKARVASDAVIAMIERLQVDSWTGIVKLFDSMVSSVLLYGAQMWGLRYLKLLESVQTYFFKKLLCLPRNTSTSMLNIVLDLKDISVEVLKRALGWVICLLKMENERFPKKCFNRLISLAKNVVNMEEALPFNWVLQLKAVLLPLNYDFLWDDLNADLWQSYREDILMRYTLFCRERDFAKYDKSLSSQFHFSRNTEDHGILVYPQKCPLELYKVKAQTRLANNYYCNFVMNRKSFRLYTREKCYFCNLSENETLLHIIMRCPFYASLRNYFFGFFHIDCEVQDAIYSVIVMDSTIAATKNLYNFLLYALQLRAVALVIRGALILICILWSTHLSTA